MGVVKAVRQHASLIAAAVLACALLVGCAQDETPASESAANESSTTASESTPEDTGAAAEASDIAAPSNSGRLRVEGAQLVSEDGGAVQLRGVSTHGLAWFPGYVNQEFFSELRNDWGANVVRLAMYTAESGGYCTDGNQTQLKALIDDGVSYATKADLYVIIDWHILSDANPLDTEEEALAFFDEMSAKYADHDNVIYEICNEPNGSTTWSDIKAYANSIIPAIRANDPDALIIVGTPTWSQDVDKAAADPLTFDNVMYTLHFYAATHKDDLRAKMQAAYDAGLPLFVTEFGICDASGSGQIDYDSANAWVGLMDDRGISYACWNLSNKNEASALFNADCTKFSGFTENDLSAEGAWLVGVLGSKGFSGETTQWQAQQQKDALAGGGDALGISWQASKVNAWESNGATFIQYSATVTNNGNAAVDSWEIAFDFTETPELSDSWNGTYVLNGCTVRIQNASYNGHIEAGGSVGDVGFIVSGSSALALCL